MENEKLKAEELRDKLLHDTYAGAFSGNPSMILDENRIKNASYEELLKIEKEHGF